MTPHKDAFPLFFFHNIQWKHQRYKQQQPIPQTHNLPNVGTSNHPYPSILIPSEYCYVSIAWEFYHMVVFRQVSLIIISWFFFLVWIENSKFCIEILWWQLIKILTPIWISPDQYPRKVTPKYSRIFSKCHFLSLIAHHTSNDRYVWITIHLSGFIFIHIIWEFYIHTTLPISQNPISNPTY